MRLTVAMATLCAGLVAWALTLPAAGQADRFAAALADWLDDEDAAALPAFAALAAAGDDRAMMMLALVDRMPETHAPWVAGLTRAERIALMRRPEADATGGGSWMDLAGGEIAALWRAAWRADTDPAVALRFAELGEARAARTVLIAHAARQRGGFAALAEDPRYPESLLGLAWAEAPDAPETGAALAGLHPGDPRRGRADPAALVDWLLRAESAAPVARFCTAVCPADPGACAAAAYRGLGGHFGLLALGPPSETLVGAGAWAASLKGARALPRRIALRRPPALDDACLARAVAIVP